MSKEYQKEIAANIRTTIAEIAELEIKLAAKKKHLKLLQERQTKAK